MAAVYSWVIPYLECFATHEGKTDVVFVIHWRRKLVDGAHTAEVYNSQTITLDPDDAFTPFNELTKSQVEGWLTAALGVDRIAELDDTLSRQIAALTTPPIVTLPSPWAA